MKERIIIATIKSWNIKNVLKFKELYKDKYEVMILTRKEKLKKEIIDEFNPKWIFFPHWSWTIPEEIYSDYPCIVFHITDLPFGRGGSPLQNLILRKVYKTKISALKVVKKLDVGPIYLKKDFYIGVGAAEEIFKRASDIIFFEMIPYILLNKPTPYEQKGEVVIFNRRRPEESSISEANLNDLYDIYDFIRMLDAEGYPKAFLRIGNFKIIFSEVYMREGKLVGRFEIGNEKGKDPYNRSSS